MHDKSRAIADILHVLYDDSLYINQKGYLNKTIDLLYNLGYYESNESIFKKGE